ncbi:MAG: PTS sugar transporter subunit IIA [Desulfatiglandaceae bacterium]|jgi:PTS system nitrogen regulatory IIA component
MEIDIKTAARMLGTPEATIRRWARQGKIPTRERSGSYVFRKDELAKWARRRNLTLMDSPSSGDIIPAIRNLSLYEFMKRGGVFFSLPGRDVREALEAACMLISLPKTVDWEILLDRLLQREELVSTGIGNGVAFPHPRYPMEDIPAGGMIATCFLENEVDFKAVDGLPVFVLFIILCPDTKTHLKLLSRLSFCLREDGFIGFLRECGNGDDLLLKVREMEDRIEENGKKGGA